MPPLGGDPFALQQSTTPTGAFQPAQIVAAEAAAAASLLHVAASSSAAAAEAAGGAKRTRMSYKDRGVRATKDFFL